MSETITIGIDHGFAAMKTAHVSFPTGLVEYEHEPYTSKDVLEYGGKYYVVGTGRQPLQKDKTQTENYYLLTLAAIAKELEYRGVERTAGVHLAAGLPLTSFGRDKKKFREYLLRDGQPVSFRYEGSSYTVTIVEVALFPQGYAAVLTQSELLDEPSVIVADIGGWTVDLMRLDNRIPNAASCRSLELGMGSFAELRKPEQALRCFVRFALAQAAVSHGMELMTALFSIAQGMVSSIMSSSGLSAMTATTLPAEMVDIIKKVGFLESIPLWAVTLLGSLFIWGLSLVMILTVYSRFFKLYMATAIAPIPMASFAGQPSSSIGIAFLKSYAAICLEGCVMVLACVIFSAFASSPPVIADNSLAAATIVWNYIGELIFNLLVLVGCIKMSDRLIRELMGLG